jgi:hydrogenase maturation protein HypF
VGFRPWVFRRAEALGLAGTIRNVGDGVCVELTGTGVALDALERALREEAPPGSRVEAIRAEAIAPRPARGLRIAASEAGGPRRAALVPDLPACEACLGEMRDPADRRHGYALLTCAGCGPRYTLARGLPFDRAVTAMADFPPCAGCRADYRDPAGRRFHAQTVACPACGPRLCLRDPSGSPRAAEDPLAETAERLAAGAVVAIKGVGGFHLACDATDGRAVDRLRRLKRREARPFAVMVADVAAAETWARLDAEARRLLASPERPVVLARRRSPPDGRPDLAPEVGAGSGLVGLLLPYTPVHHVLARTLARPLVMTSANRSGEPLARDEAELRAALGADADALDRILDHDRPIERRCDDSVVRVVGGRPTTLRRARGFAPRPIRLARPVATPGLGCGGTWKNAFALVEGEDAWVSPHVGDLDGLAACRAYDEAVADLEALLGIRPRRVAHDLHPAYYTTRYAHGRPEPRTAVAHHHAHAVSVMAEHGLEGPALALVWDGTGLGPDGAAWGGELLRVSAAGFERLATFRPLALPGADRAIAEPWRIALAALDDAMGGAAPVEALPGLRAVPADRREAVRRIGRSPRLAPRAHGVGRLFDAAAALLLDHGASRYEGEAALALEMAAGGDLDAPPYPWAWIRSSGGRGADFRPALGEIDLRPALRALVGERLAGVSPARIADRFHATLAETAEVALREARARAGALPVVAAGGCFQNDRLVRGLRARLEPATPLRTAIELPPGDGGLALGQALVADALARKEGS